jgi:ribA/ribD-fused uncharacterized protein
VTVDQAEPRSLSALLTSQDSDHLRYFYFWGHKPLPNGKIGRPCLSQWWGSPFTVDGVIYRTAEHWMMAHKARLFSDEETFIRIVASDDPRTAKALGREVRGFDEKVWDERRFDIVTAGSVAKFGQHPPLKDYLLGTGDQVLVEASPVDRIWGIGLAADDARARDPAQWCGLNLLGFALMEARARLTAES